VERAVIHIRSMAFGTFAEVEPLNPSFHARQQKMRVTVDTERVPRLAEAAVLSELVGAFPGLARHQCRAGADDGGAPAGGTRILLIPGDSAANQAHVYEHVTLELLGTIDEASGRLSGVTCAYTDPPERNDVFVECRDPDDAALAAWIAAEVMNGVLAGEPAKPLYPDVLHCARLMHDEPAHAWTPRRLGARLAMPVKRAAAALAVLSHAKLIQAEDFAMNFSGEPHYRCIAAGARRRVKGAGQG
jgi:hypothetical protein